MSGRHAYTGCCLFSMSMMVSFFCSSNNFPLRDSLSPGDSCWIDIPIVNLVLRIGSAVCQHALRDGGLELVASPVGRPCVRTDSEQSLQTAYVNWQRLLVLQLVC